MAKKAFVSLLLCWHETRALFPYGTDGLSFKGGAALWA